MGWPTLKPWMMYSDPLRKAALFFMALIAMALSSCQGPDKEEPVNILVIFTDDQSYTAIGYEQIDIHTPCLNRLASEGVIFRNHYTATPICAASRAAMMTGLFPQQNGSIALDREAFNRSYCQDSSAQTLPRILNRAGYQTWFSGKSHLGPPGDYGFQKGRIFYEPQDSSAFAYAKELINKHQANDRPFFLWLAPRQPHVPLRPSERWLNLYDTSHIHISGNFRESPPAHSMFNQGLPGEAFYRDGDYTDNWKELSAGPPRSRELIKDYSKAYYATISHLDHQVSELVQVMDKTGILENTMIIYLSDNGYFLGNHGLGNKITMHEESVRVPLFIRWPKAVKAGQESRELVSSLDLFPTILQVAGVSPPEGIPGRSLLPLLKDPGLTLHSYVASECVGVDGMPGQGHRMIRSEKWKYILTGTGDEVLYDEQNDPLELINLAGSEYEVLLQMRAFLEEWMEMTGDTHASPGSPVEQQKGNIR